MKRPQRDLQKKRDDDERLMRAWNKWHQEQLDEALAGAQGALIAELMTLLDQLELNSAKALLDRVERADWTSVDYDTRLTALHQVNAAITKLRERNGMAGIDDPLPGQPDNVFRRIKHMLFAAPPGAHAGLQTTQQRNDQTVKHHE